MIDRYVFIKLTPEHATDTARAEVVAHTREVLSSLPGVVSVKVGVPADEHARAAWDVSIAVTFASLADVEAYRVDPEHRRFVDDYLTPRMQVIKAWNFDVGPDSEGGAAPG